MTEIPTGILIVIIVVLVLVVIAKLLDHRPYLFLFFDIGFFSIRTQLMHRDAILMHVQYIALCVTIFGKRFEFALYDTVERLDRRRLIDCRFGEKH